MLKPRKCRKALLILSPCLKVAVGKKLHTVNGKWAAQQFDLYSKRAMIVSMKDMHGDSTRPRPEQLGMVARKLGSVYRRHMEKIFAPRPNVDWGMVKEMDFSRSVPTEAGGEFPLTRFGWTGAGASRSEAYEKVMGVCNNRVDFNYHDHIPNADQKHYFTTPEPNPPMVVTGCGLHNGIMMSQRMGAAKEGEVLHANPEIKGVKLKQSKPGTDLVSAVKNNFDQDTLDAILKEFGTQIELDLINRVRSGKMDEETDRNIDSVTDVIMKRWADNLFKERDSVELSLPDSDLKLTLRRPTQEDIQNIDLSSAYPKPDEE